MADDYVQGLCVLCVAASVVALNSLQKCMQKLDCQCSPRRHQFSDWFHIGGAHPSSQQKEQEHILVFVVRLRCKEANAFHKMYMVAHQWVRTVRLD